MNHCKLDNAFKAVRRILPSARPVAGLVLGTGLGAVSSRIRTLCEISYDDIPLLRGKRIRGHGGRLIHGIIHGVEVIVFQGRHHLYEGFGMDPVAAPVYLIKKLGGQMAILVNAAGALNPAFKPGNIMLINDHINLMSANPLTGTVYGDWTVNFTDMSEVYSNKLINAIRKSASSVKCRIHNGIYVSVDGPSYETPAEACFLRRIGGDAVGMSTVPEAILARAAGLKVAGISCITNKSGGPDSSHDDVVRIASVTASHIADILDVLFASGGYRM